MFRLSQERQSGLWICGSSSLWVRDAKPQTCHRTGLAVAGPAPRLGGSLHDSFGQGGEMGDNSSHFTSCGRNCPVESVSWEDTQEFIAALNRHERVNVYRLPTEAEWEYAARGRRRTGDYWYKGNSDGRPHPVGQKRANGWGVSDMLGNVSEWVADWYGPSAVGPATNPRGPSGGADRVGRSGSWFGIAPFCRVASRGRISPGSLRQNPRLPPGENPLTLCAVTLLLFGGGRPSYVQSQRAYSGRRGGVEGGPGATLLDS